MQKSPECGSCQVWGQSFRFIELPHPISNLTPEEMTAVTRRYVDQLARQLVA